MRLMYDAIRSKAVNIPANAEMVAGYVNGDYAWTSTEWGRFPNAVKIGIDVTGKDPLTSDVLDVEPGNLGTRTTDGLSPAEVESVWTELCIKAKLWAQIRRNHSLHANCYVQASRKNQLAQALDGLAGLYWMASWGISQAHAETLITGAEIAVQFLSTDSYDVSVVSDHWYAPAAPAKTPPPPAAAAKVIKSVTIEVAYTDGTSTASKFPS